MSKRAREIVYENTPYTGSINLKRKLNVATEEEGRKKQFRSENHIQCSLPFHFPITPQAISNIYLSIVHFENRLYHQKPILHPLFTGVCNIKKM